MKKLLVTALLLVLTLSLTPNVSKAEIDKDCSGGGIICKAVIMERGDLVAGTNTIWFNKGSVIDWGVNNNYASGQFQVEVRLYNVSTGQKVASEIVPYGRSTSKNFFVQASGNYMVMVVSGDSSQGRSYAFGWISE